MPIIETDDLLIACDDSGTGERGTVLLLHGWPDDASTWSAVAPRLNRAGFRTVVPTLRGFGDTRFRSESSPRTGNGGILALDAIALLDRLGIGRFQVAGHDWGSNVAETLAVGWPGRVERIALLSSPPRLGGLETPPFWHAQLEWYHWFMATARGADAVRDDPHGFARIHWENWSPPGWFEEATFERVARSFDNPDWVAVTLHSYRSRWGVEPVDPRSAALEEAVRSTKSLSLPAIYIQGEADGVNPPRATRSVPDRFTGQFEYIELAGVGHFPQREAPDAVAERLIGLFGGATRTGWPQPAGTPSSRPGTDMS